MILVDTSAWVEFLRDTGSPVCVEVDRLLAGDMASCDPVRMEVLAGARDEIHLRHLRGLIARTRELRVEPIDYEQAAAFYRTCRRRGKTVRRIIACLIGTVAMRHDVPVLHADADFQVLAEHAGLRTHELGP